MADVHNNTPRLRGARQDRVEFLFYFSMIFLLALPAAMLACGWHLIRHRSPCKGPLARARTEAQLLAPMIFRG